MIAIIAICYRNYVHYTLYRSCLPINGLLSLDRYHFYFVMILKETLIFLSLSNPILQCFSMTQQLPDDYYHRYEISKCRETLLHDGTFLRVELDGYSHHYAYFQRYSVNHTYDRYFPVSSLCRDS